MFKKSNLKTTLKKLIVFKIYFIFWIEAQHALKKQLRYSKNNIFRTNFQKIWEKWEKIKNNEKENKKKSLYTILTSFYLF